MKKGKIWLRIVSGMVAVIMMFVAVCLDFTQPCMEFDCSEGRTNDSLYCEEHKAEHDRWAYERKWLSKGEVQFWRE